MRMKNTDPDRKILSKRFSCEIWGSPCSHKFAPIYIAGMLKEVYFCLCINESKKSEIKNQQWIVPRNRTISYLPVIRLSSNFWIRSWRCNRDFHYHSVLRCFDTVFQRPYRYFSIALKVFFSLSDRYKIFTSNWLWIEICENVVLSKSILLWQQ